MYNQCIIIFILIYHSLTQYILLYYHHIAPYLIGFCLDVGSLETIRFRIHKKMFPRY